jgi:hypothetical protein
MSKENTAPKRKLTLSVEELKVVTGAVYTWPTTKNPQPAWPGSNGPYSPGWPTVSAQHAKARHRPLKKRK